MYAFNHRIRPKEYYGKSAIGFIAFIMGSLCVCLAFIPFTFFRFVFPFLALVAYGITGVAFWLHKDALFLAAIWDSRRDLKCRPKEAIEKW